MRLRPRETALLFGALILLVVYLFYASIYRPRTEELRRLTAELDRATAERQRMADLVAQRPQVEQEFQRAATRLRELEAKLPSAREIPTLLVQLEDSVRQSRARIILVRPGPLQPGGPLAQPGGAPRPGGTPLRGATPAPGATPSPEIQYQTFTVELGAEGTYEALVDFLRRLENFPRLLVLSDVRVAPTSGQPGQAPGPLLQMTVRATTYVLPEAVVKP